MIRPHDSIIVQTLGRFIIPVVQLFGLYVLFFGQYGPGGGFVGGVILGTGMILSVLIFGHDNSRSQYARNVLHGDGVGMLIYAGVGGLCMIGGWRVPQLCEFGNSRFRNRFSKVFGNRAHANRCGYRCRGNSRFYCVQFVC